MVKLMMIQDIDMVLPKILEGKYQKIVLYGHSTGGLISSIYCDQGYYKNCISGLVLNSPFFDFNDTSCNEFLLKKIVPKIGYFFPELSLRNYDPNMRDESKHIYDLDEFGLTSEQIQSDCAPIYKTFINSTNGN